MNANIPEKIFLTKGVGTHKERLASFELALREAGIASCNLVYVSSIVPPNCTLLSKNEGAELLKPGQILFCVMSRIDTNEPNRLMAAAIGMALPYEKTVYGYLSEHKSYGQTQEKAGDYAEDLAASMLRRRLVYRLTLITPGTSSKRYGTYLARRSPPETFANRQKATKMDCGRPLSRLP